MTQTASVTMVERARVRAMPTARAGRASHGAAARLHHTATIAIAVSSSTQGEVE
jgi:hypothetical protein